jgi:hypothetical protein
MSQSLETITNDLEKRESAVGSQGLLRFLARNYVADGNAYANLPDAVSRTNVFDEGGRS